VKKRKFISEKQNSDDKVPEEGECSGSENDNVLDEILDISTNSESDDEKQGLLLFVHSIFLCFIFIIHQVVHIILQLLIKQIKNK